MQMVVLRVSFASLGQALSVRSVCLRSLLCVVEAGTALVSGLFPSLALSKSTPLGGGCGFCDWAVSLIAAGPCHTFSQTASDTFVLLFFQFLPVFIFCCVFLPDALLSVLEQAPGPTMVAVRG